LQGIGTVQNFAWIQDIIKTFGKKYSISIAQDSFLKKLVVLGVEKGF